MEERTVTRKCKYCGVEFETPYANGHPTWFCSQEHRVEQRNVKRRIQRSNMKSPYFKHDYSKGKNNKLDRLLDDLKEQGIDFSEYKRQLSLSKVERIVV